MNIAGFARAALSQLRDDLDSPTFLWKGKAVPCVPQTVGNLATVAVGGFDVAITATLRVDAREFLTVDSTLKTVDSTLYTSDDDRPVPVSGKRLTFRGQEYKVGRASVSPCASYYSLDLVDRNA